MNLTNFAECGCHPPIVSCFLNTDETVLFNNRYGFRHPGGIYNVTMLYLHKSLTDFMDKYSVNTAKIEEYYDAFRLVLYDLFKFYDSCFEIIACYCDIANPPRASQFIDKWLKDSGIAAGENFKLAIGPDIEYLKKIHNKLKHTSNRISWVTVETENFSCVGYYLESYKNGGLSSVDDVLFPISINTEIRRIFYLFYRISQVLEESITQHITTTGLAANFIVSGKKADDSAWQTILNKVNMTPHWFLPNEVGKKIPVPELTSSDLIFTEKIVTQTDYDAIYKGKIQVGATSAGDGYTKQFSFPHMGLKP